MKTRTALFVIATAALIACSTGDNLPVERPEISVAQVNTSAFVQERGGTFSLDYLFEIENPADIPITAEWVELRAGEAGPYAIRQTTKNIKKVIPAGATETFTLSVWAYSYGGPAAAEEPVTLRIRMRFDSEKGSFQVNKIARILQ